MKKIYTQEDLLKYIYKETTHQENKSIELALIFDDTLESQYRKLLEGVNVLNQISERPSEESIDTILQFAKETNSQHA